MHRIVRIVLISFCLLLVSVSVGAADYKQWIPLLPGKLGGLPQSGKPDGMNMEMGGQSWSTVQQKYSDNSRTISVMIVGGIVAPQAQAFKMMSHMQMETEDQLVKTLKVSGYRAMFQLDKSKKKGTLMISVSDQALVVLEAKPVTDEGQMVTLAKEVPLGKIAAGIK